MATSDLPDTSYQWSYSNKSKIKWTAFLLPIVLSFIFLGIKIEAPDMYSLIIQEDTAIEWLQALFFFGGAVYAFMISYKFLNFKLLSHSILYGLLAAGLLFISMEEISWGQRIFNIENPNFFEENNMQGETTLHNLTTVAPLLSKFYILIGLYGAFGWLLAAGMRLNRRIPLIKFYVPDWFLGPYFIFVFLIYTYLSYLRPMAVNTLGIQELEVGYFFVFRDQEPAELLLSMGFFFFALINYLRLKKMELHYQISKTYAARTSTKTSKASSMDAFKR